MKAIVFGVELALIFCSVNGLVVIPTYKEEYSPANVSMMCHFSKVQCPGGPQWSGPALNGGNNTRIISGSGKSRLEINNIQEEDEGSYQCHCGSRHSSPSNLVVLHYPSFNNVQREQRFQSCQSAIVTCDADPGDPPLDMFWIHNSGHANPIDHQALNITSTIMPSYTCAFNLSIGGHVSVDIAVKNWQICYGLERFISSPLTHQTVRFGEPLKLACPNDTRNYSWIVNQQKINECILDLQPGKVSPGIYVCVSRAYEDVVLSVFVSLTHIPPCLEDSQEVHIRITQGDSYYLSRYLKNVLSSGPISFQWKKLIGDEETVDVDFSPRFNFTLVQRRLGITLHDLQLKDRGRYHLNISNEYGYDVLTVNINVFPLHRTSLEVNFDNTSCALVKEKTSDIVELIQSEFSCSICGDVRLEANHSVQCSSEQQGAAVLLTLLSQDSLQQLSRVEVTVNETVFSGTVRYPMLNTGLIQTRLGRPSTNQSTAQVTNSTGVTDSEEMAKMSTEELATETEGAIVTQQSIDTEVGIATMSTSGLPISERAPMILVITLLLILLLLTAIAAIIIKQRRKAKDPEHDEVGPHYEEIEVIPSSVHRADGAGPHYYEEISLPGNSNIVRKAINHIEGLNESQSNNLSVIAVSSPNSRLCDMRHFDHGAISQAGTELHINDNLLERLASESRKSSDSMLDICTNSKDICSIHCTCDEATGIQFTVGTIESHHIADHKGDEIELKSVPVVEHSSAAEDVIEMRLGASNHEHEETNLGQYQEDQFSCTENLLCQDASHLSTETDHYEQTSTYERVKYSQSLENFVAALSSTDVFVSKPDHQDNLHQVTSKLHSKYTNEQVQYSKSSEKVASPLSTTIEAVSHEPKQKMPETDPISPQYSKSSERLASPLLTSTEDVSHKPEQEMPETDPISPKLPHADSILNDCDQTCTYERVKYSKSLEDFVAALSSADVVVSKPEEANYSQNEYEQICTYERVHYSKSLESLVAAVKFSGVFVLQSDDI